MASPETHIIIYNDTKKTYDVATDWRPLIGFFGRTTVAPGKTISIDTRDWLWNSQRTSVLFPIEDFNPNCPYLIAIKKKPGSYDLSKLLSSAKNLAKVGELTGKLRNILENF
ncbi:hypothetical protein QOT17_000431 [Balamuthia mandrillaris]